MYEVTIRPEAEQDLEDIYDFIADRNRWLQCVSSMASGNLH